MKSNHDASPTLPWSERLGSLLVAVGFLVAGIWAPAVTEPLGTYPTFFVSVLILLVGAVTMGQLLRPYGRRYREDVRAVEEPHRSEYENRCAEYGTPVRGVWATDVLRGSDDFAEISGLRPGDRHLFLKDSFVDEYAPGERDAALARQAALTNGHVSFLRASLTYLVLLTYFGLVLGVLYLTGDPTPFPDWPLVPELALVPLFVAGAWVTRRKTFRANQFAAEQTDVETVLNVLKTLADEYDDEEKSLRVDESRLLRLFTREPSYRTQAERLRESQGK